MRGPAPKDPALRQRQNKASTKATLYEREDASAPDMPKGRRWVQQTKEWWRDVWKSPMATEFLQADWHALYRLAVLVDMFWREPSVQLSKQIMSEEARFGLTPLDRRRLEWKVDRGPAKAAPTRVDRGEDPRKLLRAVK